MINQLRFERVEKTLSNPIVPIIPFTAHAFLDFMGFEQRTMCFRRILTSPTVCQIKPLEGLRCQIAICKASIHQLRSHINVSSLTFTFCPAKKSHHTNPNLANLIMMASIISQENRFKRIIAL